MQPSSKQTVPGEIGNMGGGTSFIAWDGSATVYKTAKGISVGALSRLMTVSERAERTTESLFSWITGNKTPK
jgi:hypothetical protein